MEVGERPADFAVEDVGVIVAVTVCVSVVVPVGVGVEVAVCVSVLVGVAVTVSEGRPCPGATQLRALLWPRVRPKPPSPAHQTHYDSNGVRSRELIIAAGTLRDFQQLSGRPQRRPHTPPPPPFDLPSHVGLVRSSPRLGDNM